MSNLKASKTERVETALETPLHGQPRMARARTVTSDGRGALDRFQAASARGRANRRRLSKYGLVRTGEARAGDGDCCASLPVGSGGCRQPEVRQRALAAGFDVHLNKPVDFDESNRILSFEGPEEG